MCVVGWVLACVPTVARAAQYPSFSGVVEENADAVVNISTTRVVKEPTEPSPGGSGGGSQGGQGSRRQSLGSGFIIGPEGYILTCNHVIQGAENIAVTLSDESEYLARVVGTDQKTDIALIMISPGRPLQFAKLGDVDRLKVGDWVIAVGNPFGLGHTVTAGIVSAKGRVIGAGPYDDYIQTDAAINPGNSGGPLFNMAGEVVGISSAIFSTSGGSIGIGFAIPISIAREILPSLKTLGHVERGWLGVTAQKITQELAKSFGLAERAGALVADVVKGSPADRGGLKRGDVIVRYEDKQIGDYHELPRLVANTPVGKTVGITVVRDGRTVELPVQIIGMVASDAPEELIERKVGIKVRTITEEIANQLGISDGGAVLVASVAGSPGMGDFMKGDIIVEVNRRRVTSVEECSGILKDVSSGDSALFLVRRPQGYQYITVQVK